MGGSMFRGIMVSVVMGAVGFWAVVAGEAGPGTRPAAGTLPGAASEGTAAVSKEALRRKVAPAIDRALKYLAARQADDGGWPGPFGRSDPAITALAVIGFVQHPDFGPGHPIVKRAIDLILSFRQADGGLYDPQLPYANYSTSVALMALAAMNTPAVQAHVRTAQQWLKDNQWAEPKCDDEGKPINPSHVWYGGAGYGQHHRPDLSNTQMMLEALHASGLPASDPVFRKALRFIQRSQMLEQTNDQPFARGANDGGFIYTPAMGGHSMAGETTTTSTTDDQRRLRSYGSMTYAGFKSMLYANVDRADVRVQSAWSWIRQHYTLASNPNMPGAQSQEGLYYYYHVFAKALEAWGEPVVVDATSRPHDWRADLCAQLLRQQRPDGSWVNDADRWQEDNPCLVTAYAVLALQTAAR